MGPAALEALALHSARAPPFFSSSLLHSILELSDPKVYELYGEPASSLVASGRIGPYMESVAAARVHARRARGLGGSRSTLGGPRTLDP